MFLKVLIGQSWKKTWNCRCPGGSADKCLHSWSTYCFNFAWPADWRTADPTNFSFTRQFPNCAKWIARASSFHWMRLEGGVLCAIIGRASMKKEDNIVHQTMKHE
jgi:hypothetical protein